MPTYYYEDRDLYFVRVPKTASTSIMSVLGKPSDSYWDHPAIWKHQVLAQHSRTVKSLAFVRHPVERFRSAYGMWLRRGGVQSVEQALSWAFRDPPLAPELKVGVHFTPMTHLHFGLEHVRWIYRYENLDDVWKKICELVGLPPDTQLPRLREDYTKPDLTAQEEEMVRKIYQRDFRAFGYE